MEARSEISSLLAVIWKKSEGRVPFGYEFVGHVDEMRLSAVLRKCCVTKMLLCLKAKVNRIVVSVAKQAVGDQEVCLGFFCFIE